MSQPTPPDGDDSSAFPDHDFSIFLNSDGINTSAKWVLREYGKEGALSSAQQASLADRFDFSAEEIATLSKDLGDALNPVLRPLVAPISKSRATERAKDRLGVARHMIATASGQLSEAHEFFDNIAVETASDTLRGHIHRLRDELLDAFSKVVELAMSVERLEGHPDILLLEHTHPQRIRDERRVGVLQAILNLTERTDKKLGFTTTVKNSKRSGPLIEFVDAVVACVTSPPGRLSPNTIARDFTKLRSGKP